MLLQLGMKGMGDGLLEGLVGGLAGQLVEHGILLSIHLANVHVSTALHIRFYTTSA